MSNMKTTWVIDTAFEKKGLDQFKNELESLEKRLATFGKKDSKKYNIIFINEPYSSTFVCVCQI